MRVKGSPEFLPATSPLLPGLPPGPQKALALPLAVSRAATALHTQPLWAAGPHRGRTPGPAARPEPSLCCAPSAQSQGHHAV